MFVFFHSSKSRNLEAEFEVYGHLEIEENM